MSTTKVMMVSRNGGDWKATIDPVNAIIGK